MGLYARFLEEVEMEMREAIKNAEARSSVIHRDRDPSFDVDQFIAELSDNGFCVVPIEQHPTTKEM
jgi:phage terminase large subunit-like protein